jgi:hypothetical protein
MQSRIQTEVSPTSCLRGCNKLLSKRPGRLSQLLEGQQMLTEYQYLLTFSKSHMLTNVRLTAANRRPPILLLRTNSPDSCAFALHN